ncbi:DUF997 family protein [Ferrimonas marina]|uniref:Uncharacterized membrane protein YhdT n=1 Tax=Ferrimonas marina TaxID=299255 RepID=A0A1M5SF88_9GAMM|nr:DUF997 family protein [Ferrimonas marina]SHH37272.1 Uncharacterized membrane protein YhdT [Ferrimonas marina]
MQPINANSLAKGAVALTLFYFVAWLLGPLLLAEAGLWFGLPIWFWCSCILAPLLLCLLVWWWLRGGARG